MAVGAAQGLEGIEQLRQGNYWTGAGDIGFGAMDLYLILLLNHLNLIW